MEDWPEGFEKNSYAPESYTWTIYYFETESAKVIISWFGDSNGYYSESVSIEEQDNVENLD